MPGGWTAGWTKLLGEVLLVVGILAATLGSSVDVTTGRLDESVETVGTEDFVDFVVDVIVVVFVHFG